MYDIRCVSATINNSALNWRFVSEVSRNQGRFVELKLRQRNLFRVVKTYALDIVWKIKYVVEYITEVEMNT